VGIVIDEKLTTGIAGVAEVFSPPGGSRGFTT
jgi:hypothetical protein